MWNVLALGLGLAVGLIFQINILVTSRIPTVQGWAGQVLTGLVIGATGSGWHEVLDTFSSAAKNLKPPP